LVKVYHSEKEDTEDGWRLKRINLKPDTRASGYSEIVLEGEGVAELTVLGEYVASLAFENIEPVYGTAYHNDEVRESDPGARPARPGPASVAGLDSRPCA
jgi:hypothetical protein